MNHDGSGGGHADVSTGEAPGKKLLVEGRHREALELFTLALRDRPEDGEAVDGAARSLIELVREGSVDSALDAAGKDWLYRLLILQEACPVAPPILHHLIAGRHTSGDSEAIRRMAAELSPVLAALHAEGKDDVNSVLMTLIIRNALDGWITQEQISKLHLEWFPRFRLSDLSLPYSCMFAEAQFGRNRDDLAEIVRNPGRAAGWLDKLTLVQVIFLEWLLDANLLDGADRRPIVEVVSARLAGRAVPPEEMAARSLLVGHGWGAGPPDPSTVATLGLDPSLADLIASVGAKREEIRRPPAPARLGPWLFRKRAWQGVQAARNLAVAKAPALARRGRKPRVAVCISGQLRGYRVAFATWQRTLLRLMDCDIFVHSWTRIGRSTAEPYRYILPFQGEAFQEKYRETCLKLGYAEFLDRYPCLMKGLAETGYVTEGEVAAFYGSEHVHLDDERDEPFAGWSNAQKMYSKIEGSYKLVADSGRDYDLIVRIRPDLPIKLVAFDPREVWRACVERPVVFADHGAGLHYANPMIGDQLAIGAPGPMGIYSSTRTIYPELARAGLLQTAPGYQPHSSLAQVCWVHGIAVEKLPIRLGKLQDPAPLTSPEIRGFLERDAEGRHDWTDGQLLEAVAADLAVQG